VCRKRSKNFRPVRWMTSTLSSATTSSSAKLFTRAVSRWKNWRSSCASHRGETTSVLLPPQPLQYPPAGPPFRLTQPPCRQPHIQPNRRSPGAPRDSRRRHRIRRSEPPTAGRSIQTAPCRCRSCDYNLEAVDGLRVWIVCSYAEVNISVWTT